MTTITKVRSVLPALVLLGCVSDFSPDPYKPDPNQLVASDAGRKRADAGEARVDAKAASNDAADAPDPGLDDDQPANPLDTGTPSAACDLSGRWIVTERSLSVAIGAKQVSLGWHYLELVQSGDEVTVKKGLFCGGSTVNAPGDPFTVSMDDSSSWPAYQAKTNYTGRKGTSKESGGGCEVAFEEAALIRGMTVDTYKSRSVALPNKDQKASGATPGWEDWDGDGNPGITMVVEGTAAGTMYTVVRSFNSLTGSISAGASSFKLDSDWEQERKVLGSKDPDPLGLLGSEADRATDPGANYAEYARLADDQATGDDDAICDAIRALAPTLNPSANPK